MKLKFQIQQELGVKPESTKGTKGSNYAPELTEWLVSTLLSVSTRRSALTVSSKGQTVCWLELQGDMAVFALSPPRMNAATLSWSAFSDASWA